MIEQGRGSLIDVGSRLGRYDLEELLGQGAMARVFRATQIGSRGFRKQVAIKVILPEAAQDPKVIDMFVSEARIGGHLRHRNLVEAYEFDQSRGNYFLALEYVRGVDLKTLVTAGRKQGVCFPLSTALHVAEQIADGLEHAHAARDEYGRSLNLVHRDLKPANILCSYDGQIKISDFGVSLASSNVQQFGNEGTTQGTPAYMSPEQAWAQEELDGRSDLFSLTTVLYEMVAGKNPFAASDLLSMLTRITTLQSSGLLGKLAAEVPDLAPLLQRGWAHEPADRFKNATEMSRALRELRRSLPEEVEISDHIAQLGFSAAAFSIDTGDYFHSEPCETLTWEELHGTANDPTLARPAHLVGGELSASSTTGEVEQVSPPPASGYLHASSHLRVDITHPQVEVVPAPRPLEGHEQSKKKP